MKLIDFHSHILPRMDHGSRSSQVTLAQLKLMQAAGVDTVCATSHFYPQEILPETFLEARNASFMRLLEVAGDTPRPQLILGAEVLICEGLDRMENLRSLCLEGTDIMLLEMPFSPNAWSSRIFQTVADIADLGIRPVFAHVDRYPSKLVERLFDMGFTAQLNADSLNRMIKPRHLMHWIRDGHIVAMGSDLHGAAEEAYKPYIKCCASLKEAPAIMEQTGILLQNAVRR